MVKVKKPDEIRRMVQSDDYSRKRIFSIVAHIDHGKSTTADFLLKRAGLMREEDAGHLQMTDTDEEEQERGITIFTSVVLLAFEDPREKGGSTPYIFQINDTPGHLSFTGEVSRALRSSDGCIVLVDALEGMMTQTETNIRLSVGEEWCKPVLFINKVDRLISELRLEPADVYKRVDKIILEVNDIIEEIKLLTDGVGADRDGPGGHHDGELQLGGGGGGLPGPHGHGLGLSPPFPSPSGFPETPERSPHTDGTKP